MPKETLCVIALDAADYKIAREWDCHTVGYNYVEISDTPGCRNPSRDYSQQYKEELNKIRNEEDHNSLDSVM